MANPLSSSRTSTWGLVLLLGILCVPCAVFGQATAPANLPDITGPPNLAFVATGGWSAPMVVSTGTGDHADGYPLLPSDTLYLDWRIANTSVDGYVSGSPPYWIYLYIDDQFHVSWSSSQALDPGEALDIVDYSLGSLPVGVHTLRMWADATNVVAETDETDNTYTKTIWVGDFGWAYVENFNATAPGWGWDPLWHQSTACSASLPGHSTPQTLYFGVDASCTFDTGSQVAGPTGRSIDLSGASAPLALIFKYLLDTENNEGYDEAWLTFRIDGGTVYTLDNDRSNGGTLDDTGVWSTAVYDVSSWAGHTIELLFNFDSGDNEANNYEGWHVDDVGIYQLSGKRPSSLLWTQDGLAMAWTISGGGAFWGMGGFGTDTNWRATSYQRDPDGVGHLVWTDQTAGLGMVWHLTPGGTWGTMEGFGLAPGWKLTSYQRRLNGWAYLLWTDGNGSAQVWGIDPEGGWGWSFGLGAGAGWTATSYRRNCDDTSQVVWANPSTGQAMVWTLTSGGAWGGMIGLGIGPGWVANGYERNPDGSGVLLWANSGTGQAMAWTLTPTGTFGGMQGFGVSTGWEAASYLRIY